jgi:hypothetical protein
MLLKVETLILYKGRFCGNNLVAVDLFVWSAFPILLLTYTARADHVQNFTACQLLLWGQCGPLPHVVL